MTRRVSHKARVGDWWNGFVCSYGLEHVKQVLGLHQCLGCSSTFEEEKLLDAHRALCLQGMLASPQDGKSAPDLRFSHLEAFNRRVKDKFRTRILQNGVDKPTAKPKETQERNADEKAVSKKLDKPDEEKDVSDKLTSAEGIGKEGASAESVDKLDNGDSRDHPTLLKMHKCRYCESWFLSMRKLHNHLNVHAEYRPHQCKQCGKCFTQSSDLETHVRVHSTDKEFKCDKCGTACASKNSLRKHVLIHMADKPFKCEQCGKSFCRREVLKGHMRIHTGEKPFSCENCGRCFRLKENLSSHIQTHSGIKPFRCDFCGRCFTRRVNLKKHKQLIHERIKS